MTRRKQAVARAVLWTVAVVLTLVACSSRPQPSGASSVGSSSPTTEPSSNPQSSADIARQALEDHGFLEIAGIADQYMDRQGQDICLASSIYSLRGLAKEFSNAIKKDNLGFTLNLEESEIIIQIFIDAYCPYGLGTTAASFGHATYDVRYLVSGASNRADITYENDNANTSQESDTSVPWHYSFGGEPGDFVYVSAQRGENSGDITCAIQVNGEVVESNTSSRPFAICEASGTL